ncbi:hypothetical protein KAU51_02495 [Candidatus Parcubacteria bacterium]|nr:hypothetical protein [Candidatus Parcubacteria bacterium]
MDEQNVDKILNEKMERLKIQFGILQDIINRKSEILSIVSMLAVAFLVIATFNETILEVTSFIRGLLAILLFLIPLNLWSNLLDLTLAEQNNRKIIEEITGLNIKKEIKENRKKEGKTWEIITYINSYMPWISCIVLTLIILIVIFLILQPLWN